MIKKPHEIEPDQWESIALPDGGGILWYCLALDSEFLEFIETNTVLNCSETEES